MPRLRRARAQTLVQLARAPLERRSEPSAARHGRATRALQPTGTPTSLHDHTHLLDALGSVGVLPGPKGWFFDLSDPHMTHTYVTLKV